MYAGQAAEVLLDAIAASDGTRESILEQLFATSVTDGIIGSFTFNENGDPQDASGAVVAFTMYKAEDDDGEHRLVLAVTGDGEGSTGRVGSSRAKWRGD